MTFKHIKGRLNKLVLLTSTLAVYCIGCREITAVTKRMFEVLWLPQIHRFRIPDYHMNTQFKPGSYYDVFREDIVVPERTARLLTN